MILINLPEIVIFRMFSYLNETDIRNLERVCKNLETVVREYAKPLGDIELRLKLFVSNFSDFRSLLMKNQAVVGGSLILETLLQTRTLEKPVLEIFVPDNTLSFEILKDFFTAQDKYAVKQGTGDNKDLNDSMKLVSTAKLKQQIHIYKCNKNPKAWIRKNFVLSTYQGWYDGNTLNNRFGADIQKKYCYYISYFAWLACESTRDLIEKYQKMGFTIMIKRLNISIHYLKNLYLVGFIKELPYKHEKKIDFVEISNLKSWCHFVCLQFE
eukprot:NODE_83_length_22457_cov_0.375794.p4 type:complete len:269 gc:universal NODE_83_length_22457_cov_0.375794:20647-21453(+)